ncbi:hypothetical protein B0H16DRAFT_202677 [Mycena metata]|uniref:Uncharacterized protein n=1 Tax=Mycena metata TaxID=1033252 RepID=A0AAD7MTL2_9AGAR|nr:hypothetical protein B0H16DRAFT_202677 [Mycena metata]
MVRLKPPTLLANSAPVLDSGNELKEHCLLIALPTRNNEIFRPLPCRKNGALRRERHDIQEGRASLSRVYTFLALSSSASASTSLPTTPSGVFPSPSPTLLGPRSAAIFPFVRSKYLFETKLTNARVPTDTLNLRRARVPPGLAPFGAQSESSSDCAVHNDCFSPQGTHLKLLRELRTRVRPAAYCNGRELRRCVFSCVCFLFRRVCLHSP